MADPALQTYERLPGAGYRRIVPGWAILLLFFVIGIFALLLRGRRVRLYLGREHLLAVETDGYREHYKRFRFGDIQSLTVRKTIEGKATSTILGGLAVILIALGVAAGDAVGTTILCIIGGIFGLVAIVNFLSGPTCECQLRTAVQTEELVSLRRLRHALKAIERLRPLIVEAQGQFSAEEIYAKTQETLAAEYLDAPPVIAAAAPAPAAKPPPRHYRSKVHFILFCLLVTNMPITVLDIVFNSNSPIILIGVLHLFTEIGFAIASLAKQKNTNLPAVLKRIPWIVLISIPVAFIAVGINSAFNSDSTLQTSYFSDPVEAAMSLFLAVTSVCLGVMGFIHLRKFRAAHAAANLPPPVTPPPTP